MAAVQISDWITPVPSPLLLARGVPGAGHVDIRGFVEAALRAEWAGNIEVEIFNQVLWGSPPDEVALAVAAAFAEQLADVEW